MRSLCLLMGGLAAGGTLYATVNSMGAGLILFGTAVAILNVFAYALWDDPRWKDSDV